MKVLQPSRTVSQGDSRDKDAQDALCHAASATDENYWRPSRHFFLYSWQQTLQTSWSSGHRWFHQNWNDLSAHMVCSVSLEMHLDPAPFPVLYKAALLFFFSDSEGREAFSLLLSSVNSLMPNLNCDGTDLLESTRSSNFAATTEFEASRGLRPVLIATIVYCTNAHPDQWPSYIQNTGLIGHFHKKGGK